jgi:hypothetical protein
LPLFALCLVIAVVGVILTRTVALPGRYAGHDAVPATGAGAGAGAGEDSGEGTGEGDENSSGNSDENGDEGAGGGAGTPSESPAAGENADQNAGQPPPANPPKVRQPAPRPQRPPKPAPKPAPPNKPAPPSNPGSPPPSSVPPSSTPPSPIPPPAIGYEAESAANGFTSTARVVTCQPCSGGKKVGHLGRDAGTLQFNDVHAAADGKVEITIAYLNGDTVARGADVSVDGADATTVSFPVTGGWNTVATIRLTVTLKAGANTIRFSGKGPAPDVDRISVGG